MKLVSAADLLLATLAGFVGAGMALLLFHGTPLHAQTASDAATEKTVIQAHEFLLLNSKNETVGRLATSGSDGLPFLVFEGLERDGILFKDGAIYVGFVERIPQIRVHGADRKSGVIQAVGHNEGGLSILGERGKQIITLKPSQGKAWEQMLEGRNP